MDNYSIIASGGWTSPSPQLWDTGIHPNTNMKGTAWNRNGVPVPAKTSAEFAKINTEVMTKEQVLKQLNNALVALEEAESAWQEEHDARVEAEATIEALREAGFTGVEAEESAEDDSDEVDPFEAVPVPKYTAPRGGITYHTPPSNNEMIAKMVSETLRKGGRL